MKYIDSQKLIAEIERRIEEINIECQKSRRPPFSLYGKINGLEQTLNLIRTLQQEQQKENKLPNKRTRVNYAICNLQSFKPLREAIVLDDYIYDKSKCYRENLLNYIHAIPENRLTEIRSYLKEKGWWPYDDDTDWVKQEQLEVDLVEEITRFFSKNPIPFEHYTDCPLLKNTAIHFYELGLTARKEE